MAENNNSSSENKPIVHVPRIGLPPFPGHFPGDRAVKGAGNSDSHIGQPDSTGGNEDDFRPGVLRWTSDKDLPTDYRGADNEDYNARNHPIVKVTQPPAPIVVSRPGEITTSRDPNDDRQYPLATLVRDGTQVGDPNAPASEKDDDPNGTQETPPTIITPPNSNTPPAATENGSPDGGSYRLNPIDGSEQSTADYVKSQEYKRLHDHLEKTLADTARIKAALPQKDGESDGAYKARLLREMQKRVIAGDSVDADDPLYKIISGTGIQNKRELAQVLDADIQLADAAETSSIIARLKSQLTGKDPNYVDKYAYKRADDYTTTKDELKYFNGDKETAYVEPAARLDRIAVEIVEERLQNVGVSGNEILSVAADEGVDGADTLGGARKVLSEIVDELKAIRAKALEEGNVDVQKDGQEITFGKVLAKLREKYSDASGKSPNASADRRLAVQQARALVRRRLYENAEEALRARDRVRSTPDMLPALSAAQRAMASELNSMEDKLMADPAGYKDELLEGYLSGLGGAAGGDRTTREAVQAILDRKEVGKHTVKDRLFENLFDFAQKGVDRFKRTAIDPVRIARLGKVSRYELEEGQGSGKTGTPENPRTPGGGKPPETPGVKGPERPPTDQNDEGIDGAPVRTREGEPPGDNPTDDGEPVDLDSAPVNDDDETEDKPEPLQTSFSLGIGVMDNMGQRQILQGADFVSAEDMRKPMGKVTGLIKRIWQRGLFKGNFDVRSMRYSALMRETAMNASGLKHEDGVPVEVPVDLLQRALVEGEALKPKRGSAQWFKDGLRNGASAFFGIGLNADQRRAIEWFKQNPDVIKASREGTIDELTEVGERFATAEEGVTTEKANETVISTTRRETRQGLVSLLALEGPESPKYVEIQGKIRDLVREYAKPDSTLTRELLLTKLNALVKADIIPNVINAEPEEKEALANGNEFASNILTAAEAVKKNWDRYNTPVELDAEEPSDAETPEGQAPKQGKAPIDELNFDIYVGRADWGGARDAEQGTKLEYVHKKLKLTFKERLAKRFAEKGFGPSEKVMTAAGALYDAKIYAGLYAATALAPMAQSQAGLAIGAGTLGVGTAAVAGFREGGIYVAHDDGRLRGLGGRYLADVSSANRELRSGRVSPDRAKVLKAMEAAMVEAKPAADLTTAITTLVDRAKAGEDVTSDLLAAVAHAKARLDLTDELSMRNASDKRALAVAQNFVSFSEGKGNAERRALMQALFKGDVELGKRMIDSATIQTASLIDQAQLRLHSDPEKVAQWLVTTQKMSEDDAKKVVADYYKDRGITEPEGLNAKMRVLQKLSDERTLKVGATALVLGTAGKLLVDAASGEISAARADWNSYTDNWDSVLRDPETLTKSIVPDGQGGYTAGLSPTQEAALKVTHLDRLVPSATRFQAPEVIDGVPVSLPEDVYVVDMQQTGDRVIFDGATGEVHSIRDFTFTTQDWDGDGVPDLTLETNNANGFPVGVNPEDELPGFTFDRRTGHIAGGSFGPQVPEAISVDGQTIHTSIPDATHWEDVVDAQGNTQWNLVSDANPTVHLIHDAQFNPDGSIDTTNLDPASMLNASDITTTTTPIINRLNPIGTGHSALSILDAQGNIDPNGEWGQHVTEISGRTWHATNGSQLGLHTNIEPNGTVTLDIHEVMDRSPYVNSVVQGGGQDYGWQFTLGGHGKEGIIVLNSSPELSLDPTDVTTQLRLANGGTITPAELLKLVGPGGTATEFNNTPEMWSLGGGHIEAGRLITNADGSQSFEAWATIRGEGDIAVPSEVGVPEPGEQLVNVITPPDLGETSYTIVPPFDGVDVTPFAIPYGIPRERTVKPGEEKVGLTDKEIEKQKKKKEKEEQKKEKKKGTEGKAPTDVAPIMPPRPLGDKKDKKEEGEAEGGDKGGTETESAVDGLPADATIEQKAAAHAEDTKKAKSEAGKVIGEYLKTHEVDEAVRVLKAAGVDLTEDEIKSFKANPEANASVIAKVVEDLSDVVHSELGREANTNPSNEYISKVREYVSNLDQAKLSDALKAKLAGFELTPEIAEEWVKLKAEILSSEESYEVLSERRAKFKTDHGLTEKQFEAFSDIVDKADLYALEALESVEMRKKAADLKVALGVEVVEDQGKGQEGDEADGVDDAYSFPADGTFEEKIEASEEINGRFDEDLEDMLKTYFKGATQEDIERVFGPIAAKLGVELTQGDILEIKRNGWSEKVDRVISGFGFRLAQSAPLNEVAESMQEYLDAGPDLKATLAGYEPTSEDVQTIAEIFTKYLDLDILGDGPDDELHAEIDKTLQSRLGVTAEQADGIREVFSDALGYGLSMYVTPRLKGELTKLSKELGVPLPAGVSQPAPAVKPGAPAATPATPTTTADSGVVVDDADGRELSEKEKKEVFHQYFGGLTELTKKISRLLEDPSPANLKYFTNLTGIGTGALHIDRLATDEEYRQKLVHIAATEIGDRAIEQMRRDQPQRYEQIMDRYLDDAILNGKNVLKIGTFRADKANHVKLESIIRSAKEKGPGDATDLILKSTIANEFGVTLREADSIRAFHESIYLLAKNLAKPELLRGELKRIADSISDTASS